MPIQIGGWETQPECSTALCQDVTDMQFNATKRQCKKFQPRVRVWKLKEEETCEAYQNMVKDNAVKAEWKCLDVNEHW